MKITTWNINSVRLRMPLVARFLQAHAPDVICLQETKCRDAEFPSADFRALGYGHLAIHGQKGYHGVAIASKHPIRVIDNRDFCAAGHARHIAVELEADGAPLKLHNFYVPAGGDEPDAAINPKFAHKLGFLDEMTEWIRTERVADGRAVLVGDLNIAPLEHDVLEPQGAAESRQPHAGGSRKAQESVRGRRVDRTRFAVSCRKTRSSIHGGVIARRIGP